MIRYQKTGFVVMAPDETFLTEDKSFGGPFDAKIFSSLKIAAKIAKSKGSELEVKEFERSYGIGSVKR